MHAFFLTIATYTYKIVILTYQPRCQPVFLRGGCTYIAGLEGVTLTFVFL